MSNALPVVVIYFERMPEIISRAFGLLESIPFADYPRYSFSPRDIKGFNEKRESDQSRSTAELRATELIHAVRCCFAGRGPGGSLFRSANQTKITYDPTGRREDDGKGREALLAVFLIFLPDLPSVLSLHSSLHPSLSSPFSRLLLPLLLHLLVLRRAIATHRDLVGHDGHEQRVER